MNNGTRLKNTLLGYTTGGLIAIVVWALVLPQPWAVFKVWLELVMSGDMSQPLGTLGYMTWRVVDWHSFLILVATWVTAGSSTAIFLNWAAMPAQKKGRTK